MEREERSRRAECLQQLAIDAIHDRKLAVELDEEL